MLRAALLLPLLLITACGATNAPFAAFEAPSLSPPRPGDPRTNPAVAQACREQVSAETRRQERGNMMREDDRGSLNAAPFAGQGAISSTERLGQQFQFDRRVNECIRANTTSLVQPAAETPAPPAAPARTRRGAGT